MKATKAYIIRVDTDMSKEYAKMAADSCDKIGLPWEYFEGYMPKQERQMWRSFEETAGIPIKKYKPMNPRAAGCTASHAHLWKQIADNKECVIVLEHDGIMFHPLDIDVPEDKIAALGYKYYNWESYDYKNAGPTQRWVDVAHNPGSHAYAIHWKCAQQLVNEIIDKGITEAIDNRHFMQTRHRYTKTPICIADPIAGIGALRLSTIWGVSATHNNIQEMLPSFKEHFHAEIREHASAVNPKTGEYPKGAKQ